MPNGIMSINSADWNNIDRVINEDDEWVYIPSYILAILRDERVQMLGVFKFIEEESGKLPLTWMKLEMIHDIVETALQLYSIKEDKPIG